MATITIPAHIAEAAARGVMNMAREYAEQIAEILEMDTAVCGEVEGNWLMGDMSHRVAPLLADAISLQEVVKDIMGFTAFGPARCVWYDVREAAKERGADDVAAYANTHLMSEQDQARTMVAMANALTGGVA